MDPGPVRRALAGRATTPAGGTAVPDRELIGLDEADRPTIERSLEYTMTGVMRLAGARRRGALLRRARHARRVRRVRRLARRLGAGDDPHPPGRWASTDRDIYLYDTFEGMTEPTEHDASPVEPPALETWERGRAATSAPWPEFFDPELLQRGGGARDCSLSTGYPARAPALRAAARSRRRCPARAPDRLALLRLDTDWYESTRHELEHLYPRLVDGGVLIIDDYGHWEGARRAVDEYFAAHAAPLLLSRDRLHGPDRRQALRRPQHAPHHVAAASRPRGARRGHGVLPAVLE